MCRNFVHKALAPNFLGPVLAIERPAAPGQAPGGIEPHPLLRGHARRETVNDRGGGTGEDIIQLDKKRG